MAEDWPDLGVNGQGISSQAVPTQWSEDKNIKWRCKLPARVVRAQLYTQ